MKISDTNKKRYNELGIDTSKLRIFYIQEAKGLLYYLCEYEDEYSIELSIALLGFTYEQDNDLVDIIDRVKERLDKKVIWYNSFEINDTLFNITYPEPEWMEGNLLV